MHFYWHTLYTAEVDPYPSQSFQYLYSLSFSETFYFSVAYQALCYQKMKNSISWLRYLKQYFWMSSSDISLLLFACYCQIPLLCCLSCPWNSTTNSLI